MPGKILIVDDDLNFRQGLNLRLRAKGYTTAFASDGVSAVAAARREEPDLILLDIGMPGGDGFVVMQRLRNLASVATVPVIVMSARPADANRARALEAGASAFLQKPLDNDLLADAIQRSLNPLPE